MRRKTYGDVKRTLSRVASQVGLNVNDSRLLEIVNEAQERLCGEGEWPWMYERIRFCQYEGLVALPHEYEALSAVVLAGTPIQMTDPWYEFVESGPGPQDIDGSRYNVVIPRGESPVFRQPQLVPQKVKIYSSVDERVDGTRATIRIHGYDENGVLVRTNSSGVWSDGEVLDLRGDDVVNYATSTNKFSRITFIEKPRTNGYLILNYIDDDLVESQAGRYQHFDVNPSFRMYHLPYITDATTKTVQARVRRRLLPIYADTDPMTITNISALKHAVKAISLGDQGKDPDAETSFMVATRILMKESNLYRGGQPKQRIEVRMSGAFAPDYIY
jgi:hypothetical protein